jgi:uncharacterized protein YbaP (TraB family)
VVTTGAFAAETSPTGKHCLWRVTNAPAPFYLLGSIHYLRKSDYPLATVMDNAIAQSKRFLFEINPNESARFRSALQSAARYPIGVQVQRRVRPETWAYLKKISHGGGYEWTHYKPWAIAIFILHHPGFQSVSTAYGVESYVKMKVAKRPHEFGGLESAEEHVHVLSDMTDLESEVFLLEALVYANQIEARYAATVAAWKRGDIERIHSLQMPDISDAPGLNPRILDNRNISWIPRIEAAIKSGEPTTVVAGAGHFSGPRSVINLLRARGYKIEQL